MSDENNKMVRKNQLKLLGLFAIVFVPMATATSMYFGDWGVPSGSTNKGELIWPPISISDLNASDNQGQPLSRYFSLDEPGARPLKWDMLTEEHPQEVSESQWVLLVTGNEVCNEHCQQALYTVRQVNTALGKESKRVSRVLVSSAELGGARTELIKQYPMLSLASMNVDALNFFASDHFESAETVTNAWNIWVVDPLGNVILRYEADRHGKDILKDMKRLLKLSNIG